MKNPMIEVTELRGPHWETRSRLFLMRSEILAVRPCYDQNRDHHFCEIELRGLAKPTYFIDLTVEQVNDLLAKYDATE